MARLTPETACYDAKPRLPLLAPRLWPLTVALATSISAAFVPVPGAQDRSVSAKPVAQDSKSVAGQEGKLEFRVIDARDRTPLANVSIVVFTADVGHATALTTHEDGFCSFAIPKHTSRFPPFLGISARKEGFVHVQVTLLGGELDTKLPESYTLALEPGAQIGGTVRDRRGRPVAGALVYVWLEREKLRNAREQVFLDDDYHLVTDDQGRWKYTMIPDDLSVKDRLSFRVIHPDYVSESLSYRRSLPIAELSGLTSVMVMQDGVPLTGRVVNSRRLPVVGARVFLQGPGYIIDPTLLTPEQLGCLQKETDADGRYRFGHIEPGEHKVTVEAQGYIRQDAPVVVEAKSEHAEIRLTSVEEMEEAAQVARLQFDRMLAADEIAGPNDIPQEWVLNGILVVAAGIILIWTLSRWRVRRRVST
jgi:hypothetical protein